MATLFNNENALLFNVLCRVINEIYHGKRLDAEAVRERIRAAFPGEEKIISEAEEDIINVLFTSRFEGSDALKPFYNAPVPSLPSAYERLWLKNMLQDKTAAFLLPDALREKLSDRLADTEEFSVSEVWEKRQAKGDDPEEEPLRGRLALIWQALREKKKLRYVNIDKSGTRHDRTLSPCRFEYDAAMNRYFLIVWDEAENRAVKINIRRLETLEIAKEPIPGDTDDKFLKFLSRRQKSVVFRLVDNQNTNAFDRCYSLFSAYDKEAFAESEDVYNIKVYYQDFDRREIIARILSLGSAAIVLEPEDIRDEMVERLKQAWELYKDE